jgi:hypothetical protein
MTTVCALDGQAVTLPALSLQIGAVYSGAQKDAQSFLRVYNADTVPGSISVTLASAQRTYDTWVSPQIAAGTERQFTIGEIESGIGLTTQKPDYYTLKVSSGIAAYVQHVLWRSSDGTLTNLSTCSDGVSAPTDVLSSVHTSVLGSAGYPSTIAITNTGQDATPATIGFYDATTGSKLAAFTTPAIPPGGEAMESVADMETAAGLSPGPSSYHYVLKIEGHYAGFMQHLLMNTKAGVVTDMTTVCALRKSATALQAALSPVGK